MKKRERESGESGKRNRCSGAPIAVYTNTMQVNPPPLLFPGIPASGELKPHLLLFTSKGRDRKNGEIRLLRVF